MIKRQEFIIRCLGRVILIILFFFIISAFSGNSYAQTAHTIRYEFVFELQTDYQHATIADDVQLPSFQRSWVSMIDNLNIRLFNKDFKIFIDNNIINHRILCLQKIQLSHNPLLVYKFYNHQFPKDSDELPILS
jgi:hypothetical protein